MYVKPFLLNQILTWFLCLRSHVSVSHVLSAKFRLKLSVIGVEICTLDRNRCRSTPEAFPGLKKSWWLLIQIFSQATVYSRSAPRLFNIPSSVAVKYLLRTRSQREWIGLLLLLLVGQSDRVSDRKLIEFPLPAPYTVMIYLSSVV